MIKMLNKELPESLVSSPSKNKQTCLCCRIKFESPALQRCHFKTEWHSYNLKRRVCELEPIDLNSFNEIQEATAKKNGNEAPKAGSKSAKKDWTTELTEPSNPSVSTDDDDWEQIEEDDDEYDIEEAAELMARVIKTDTCLFCDKKSTSIKSNVAHMSIHGFFVPEEQYLIDLEGLIEYLGYKVGAGATCLWCNKEFTSVHGVRLHMMYKNHCKILYNQEKAIEEFKEFYDYSTQEHIEMKPLDQLVIVKKRYERRTDKSVKNTSTVSDSKQLVVKKDSSLNVGLYKSKSFKKFYAIRARTRLMTGMANNNTLRGRLRQQNPI